MRAAALGRFREEENTLPIDADVEIYEHDDLTVVTFGRVS